MSRIIIIRPGKSPETSPVVGSLRLEYLHETIGTDILDARGLGTIPPAGTRVHMWIDDMGRYNPEALPNRRLPNGDEIHGVIVLCGIYQEDDVGLNDAEIEFLLRDIKLRWEKLDPASAKTEPPPARVVELGSRR